MRYNSGRLEEKWEEFERFLVIEYRDRMICVDVFL